MTDPFDEHGEILRRALHAEADSVMPAPDGLERIRERIAGPRGGREPLGGLAGPRRTFGWAWFTESWARPLLAAGAALVIAVLAVSAPPAIHGITSAGDRGPAAHDKPRHGSSGIATQGNREEPPYPGVLVTPHPSSPVSPTPSASGTPHCPVTSPTVRPRTSPHSTLSTSKTPAPHHTTSPACPKPSVTPTPTPAPTTPLPSLPVTPSVPPQSEPPVQPQSAP